MQPISLCRSSCRIEVRVLRFPKTLIDSELTQTLAGSFDKSTTTDMSEGMTYLNEGFVMFYSGTAPDCLGSGGVKEVVPDIREVSRQPQMSTLFGPLTDALLQAKKKDRTNGTNIWVDPPEGYKWLTGNQVGLSCLVDRSQ